MSGAPRLRVTGLSFAYPDRRVFTGWSAELGPGLTWLRGSNGSGKSTLLKLLAGALTPRAGQCSVAGVEAAVQPLDYRRRVFWCGPGAIPFDHLRSSEFFAFMQGLYPAFDPVALAIHCQALRLDEVAVQPLRSLSTGTQRKVWLAAALAAGTPLVLLDEPLNALDQGALQHMRKLLSQAVGDPHRCWLVASHEPPCSAAAPLRTLNLDSPLA